MKPSGLTQLHTKLLTRLRDPLQLRIAMAGTVLVAWYFLFYLPAETEIAQASADREKAESRLHLAREIEALRAEANKFRGRLPGKTDPNEWVEFFLAGIRKYPLRLLKLEPKGIRQHGPFEVITVRIELQGAYSDLDGLLGWVESNPRLLRVDSIVIEPQRGGSGGLVMQLIVLGVMG